MNNNKRTKKKKRKKKNEKEEEYYHYHHHHHHQQQWEPYINNFQIPHKAIQLNKTPGTLRVIKINNSVRTEIKTYKHKARP